MTRPPFPQVLDSTIVATWRSCQRKAQLEYFEHWKPKGLSVHLHAGAAFARGIEVARESFYVDKLPAEAAVARGLGALLEAYGNFECPEDSPKSATRMAGALEYYFDQYPLETDKATPAYFANGKRGIEFSFAEPIDIDHPVSGDPILYCGRMDMIADYLGARYGVDEKTTSQLGASWSKQWDLRSQFTGYCWGAGKSGYPLQGFLVRGVSILKTKYETQQAITYRPQWMIDRWYEQLLRNVEAMLMAWSDGVYDYDLDHACTEYGGCAFRKVCLSQDTETWLNADFEKRIWDPISRTERKPGEEVG